MNKEFIIYRDTLIEALDHLDEFKTKMDNFVSENEQYSYEEFLTDKAGSWEVKIKVKKNEQVNT